LIAEIWVFTEEETILAELLILALQYSENPWYKGQIFSMCHSQETSIISLS